MSSHKSKKRAFAEIDDDVASIKDIYKLTKKQKTKKTKKREQLPKHLQDKMGKAMSLYWNKDFDGALALA